MTVTATEAPKRWELYKLLAEPIRLRLLCLAEEEELAIGELAELLRESQPNVSRHVAPLKRAGLVAVRKQGTRALVVLERSVLGDPVLADALAAGRVLCTEDGTLARVSEIVAKRDQPAREFFAKGQRRDPSAALVSELPAYLSAFALLVPNRRLAVDAGTGDGSLLEVIAPVYERVIAFDREEAQLARARERVARHGHRHVELSLGEVGDDSVRQRVTELGGADAVFASRVLHHAPRPARAMKDLAALLAEDGAVVVIDYCPHEDETMREQQADLWLGFSQKELEGFAKKAGLSDTRAMRIPSSLCGEGPDGHLDWQVFVGRKGKRAH